MKHTTLQTISLLGLFCVAVAAVGQSAPFCVHSGAGMQCIYYSAQQCQSAARTFQGVCAPNTLGQSPGALPPATPSPYAPPPAYSGPGIGDSFQRGYESGRRATQTTADVPVQPAVRAPREDPDAWEKYAAAAETAYQGNRNGASNSRVTYKCYRPDGTAVLTTVPEAGCLVHSVQEK